MAEYSGWRNFWWLNVALHVATFLMCLVGFPETKWHRAHPDDMHHSSANVVTPSSCEKAPITAMSGSEVEADLPALSTIATPQRDPYLGKGTPSKRQFRLYSANKHPFKSIFMDLWIPWKLFTFPIVEFASFVVSWSASSFLTINLTQSQALEPPPYSFSPLAVGLSNFSSLIGALIGLLTAGPLSDWVSMRLTRRNNGIREPEMRLPSMIPYVLIMILGNFMVAFGYQEKWDWRVSSYDERDSNGIGH